MSHVQRITFLALVAFAASAGGCSAEVADACSESSLVSQCPPGSSPTLAAESTAQCNGAVGTVVSDGSGQATAACRGEARCVVLCQFDSPCLCGVSSITKTELTCARCDDLSGCGDGVCADGESPQECPIDCGVRCNNGEKRCAGEALEECNLQGRWETVACGSDEVCMETGGFAGCADRGIIITDDAGTDDAGTDTPVEIDCPQRDTRITCGQAPFPGTGTFVGPGGAPTPSAARQISRPGVFVMAYFVAPDHLRQFVSGAWVDWDLSTDPAGVGEYYPFPEPVPSTGSVEVAASNNTAMVKRNARMFVIDLAAVTAWEVSLGAARFGATSPMAVSADGSTVAFVANEESFPLIGVQNVSTREVMVIGPLSSPVGQHIALSPGGQILAIATIRGNGGSPDLEGVALWDTATGERIYTIHPPAASAQGILGVPGRLYFFNPHGMDFSPAGDALALVSIQTGEVEIWDLPTGRRTTQIQPVGRGNLITGVRYSPDGAWLAVSSILERQHQVSLWETDRGARLGSVELTIDGPVPGDSVQSLAIAPGGGRIAHLGSIGVWLVE